MPDARVTDSKPASAEWAVYPSLTVPRCRATALVIATSSSCQCKQYCRALECKSTYLHVNPTLCCCWNLCIDIGCKLHVHAAYRKCKMREKIMHTRIGSFFCVAPSLLAGVEPGPILRAGNAVISMLLTIPSSWLVLEKLSSARP